MRYYGNSTLKRFSRTTVFVKDQRIFIEKIGKKYMYGNSYDGRWKCDLETNTWYQWENGSWKTRGGTFIEL